MEPELTLTKLSGDGDCYTNECPAGYVTNRGTLVFQGPAVGQAEELRLGKGEQAVEVPIEIVREALRALGT